MKQLSSILGLGVALLAAGCNATPPTEQQVHQATHRLSGSDADQWECAGAPAGGYSFEQIDNPSALANTNARAINARGQIVGYFDAGPDGNGGHGYLLDNGTFTQIDVPGALNTDPRGINARGTIVGDYGGTDGLRHGFILTTDGEFQFPVDPPGGSARTRLLGVNARGDIVGDYRTTSTGPSHGFLRTKSGEWSTIDVPGATATEALGINARGDVVGNYDVPGGVRYAFYRSKDGSYAQLAVPNVPGSTLTAAAGVNDCGDVVGRYRDGAGAFFVFLVSDGSWSTFAGPNWKPVQGPPGAFNAGITNRGEVVGWFQDVNNKVHGFKASPNYL